MDLNSKNISEIIVNNIINKIISLTISKALKIKTDKEVPTNCYEFVKKTINNILCSYYIFYDKDERRNYDNKNDKSFFKSDIEKIQKERELDINNTNFLEKNGDESDLLFKNYFFNNIYKGEDNDWNLIDEPISKNLDRYSSTLITFKEKNKNIEGGDKYKINHEGIQEVDENENEENNENKNKNNNTNFEKEKEKEKDKDKDKEIIKNIITKKRISKEKNEIKLKIKDIANQFECFDLDPEDNNQGLEANQINKLREQFEKNKKHKDLEQKIIHEEKEKLINIQKTNEENNKKYIGKKITKDHNGQIIFIKRIKPESLKQDFIFGKTKYKTIINNENQKKKNIKESKNIENNNQENADNKNNENLLKKASKKVSIRSLPKLGNIKTRFSTIETQDKNEDMKTLSVKRRFPIITSGSNFNLMNMEIGVSLKEDEKYKTGGLDFLSKFKKFSLNAYDKKLKEAEAANNLKKNIEIIEEPKSNTIEEMNNLYPTNYTMGYSTTYGNNYFSSTQTDPNNFINRNMNNKMYSTNNSSVFNQYIKNINNNSKDNPQKNNSFNPFIQLNMGSSSSLIGSLDKLNLALNEEERSYKKRKNIFRTKKNILKKENKFFLDDINLFTKNLITNKKNELKGEMDIKMNTIGGVKSPEKPNMREIIKEIGLKGKLMRNRSRVLAPIKSNYIETENFFKQ